MGQCRSPKQNTALFDRIDTSLSRFQRLTVHQNHPATKSNVCTEAATISTCSLHKEEHIRMDKPRVCHDTSSGGPHRP